MPNSIAERVNVPTKPSETGFCLYPETCDSTLQCEHWLRNHTGCSTIKAERVQLRDCDKLDWQSLVLAVHPSREEIANAVYFHGMQDGWQDLREILKGKPLEYRFKALVNRLSQFENTRVVQVQVSNYVLALKRGGMWK